MRVPPSNAACPGEWTPGSIQPNEQCGHGIMTSNPTRKRGNDQRGLKRNRTLARTSVKNSIDAKSFVFTSHTRSSLLAFTLRPKIFAMVYCL
jgi:hypothetical protein